MRRTRIWICFLLVLAQLGAITAPARAAGGLLRLSEKVESMAGGWNAATPVIVGGVGVAQHVTGHRELEADRFLNRQLLGGLAGDVALLTATRFALRALPLPLPARILAMTAAGFLGWEAGSDFFADTDWVHLGAQIGAATAMQILLPVALASMGLAAPAVLVIGASIVAAMGAGLLVDWLRRRGEKQKRRRMDDRWRDGDGTEAFAEQGPTDFVTPAESVPAPDAGVPGFEGLELSSGD